jgi:hypothetical protein
VPGTDGGEAVKLNDDQMEIYDPQAHGWMEARPCNSEAFPEVGLNRDMVWLRDFFIRGSERLVVEFSSAYDLKAVARDGEWLPEATWETLRNAMTR